MIHYFSLSFPACGACGACDVTLNPGAHLLEPAMPEGEPLSLAGSVTSLLVDIILLFSALTTTKLSYPPKIVIFPIASMLLQQ